MFPTNNMAKSRTAPKVPVQEVDRNSVNGQFVTEKYAKSHPKTTEHERIKHPN